MRSRIFNLYMLTLVITLIALSCAPKATPIPAVDTVGTIIAQLVKGMLTQTAAASPVVAPPQATSAVTSSHSIAATNAVVDTVTKNPDKHTITVINHTACWFGPGASYKLDSYINVPKKVELLGIGSVPGWYVIKNPYFRSPCWVAISDTQVDPDVDLSKFPVIPQ
jgi:hypothetical protein